MLFQVNHKHYQVSSAPERGS